MPRKNKKEELAAWLKNSKPFLLEVDFVVYKAQVCILADSYNEALSKAAATYPELSTRIIQQLTQVII
jgi:hypothetical protein